MTTPHGIIPAMVTPLTADDEINVPALRKLTNYLIDGGVHGLFSVGSQGEFWALSADEKRLIWQIVLEEAAGRVPVYAGSAAISTRETVMLTHIAEEVGVDAVSVLAPFYVSPSEDELYRHYRVVAESTNLPVILYQNPGRTGVRISPKLVVRLVWQLPCREELKASVVPGHQSPFQPVQIWLRREPLLPELDDFQPTGRRTLLK